MHISADAFNGGDRIPEEHTCDGDDLVPSLSFTDVPDGTVSFALILDDPDATNGGVWDHWVVYNLPAETRRIAAGDVPAFPSGRNSWGKEGYGGPCPPHGSPPHRYFFRLYALDTDFTFAEPPSAAVLRKAMRGHCVAEASCMGRYGRQSPYSNSTSTSTL